MPPSARYSSRLHCRLALKAPRLLHAAIDQRDDAQVFGGAGGFVAAVEQAEHEALDALRPRGLGEGRLRVVVRRTV